MKRKIFIVVLLLAILCIWWLASQPKGQVFPPAVQGLTNEAVAVSQGRPAGANPPNAITNLTETNVSPIIAAREQRREESRLAGLNDWRTPIEFFGKVVDESTNPIAEATIDFSCNDLSETGTSFYHAKSDSSGLFSIKGIKGKLLTAKVSKEGYYASKRDNDSFYYAGQNINFTPDASNPVIFHLVKKGTAEPLIHVHAAMGGAKGFKIARDGTPFGVSLTTGKQVPAAQADFVIECQTDDLGKPRGQKYDWKCRVSVPNGGIQQYSGEFPFQAPSDGYQASDQIDMLASDPKHWGTNAKRNYFLRLPNGNYARMNFGIIAAGDHFFEIESFLNPSGSPNLEFDSKKASDPSQ